MRGQPPDNRSDLWALGVMLYQAAHRHACRSSRTLVER